MLGSFLSEWEYYVLLPREDKSNYSSIFSRSLQGTKLGDPFHFFQ